MFHYQNHGTCSTGIDLEINGEGVITYCKFIQGCQGNTEGINRLVVGRKADEVAAQLEGVDCKHRGTSCPDQLSKAIRAYQAQA